jgi:DNA-binding GntR family transcriptional regulator
LDKIAHDHLLEVQVFRRLKKAILTLEFKPGEPLVEVVLARELGVSKTPVRAALSRLLREDLVTYAPFKGYCVAVMSEADIREIFELRSLLEGWAARVAAVTMSEDQIAECRQLLGAVDEAARLGDMEAYYTRGSLLHQRLLDCVGNRRLQAVVSNITDQSERLFRMNMMVPGRPERSAVEHAAVVRAIEQRNPDEAERSMRAHIRAALEDFLDQGAPRE